MANPSEPVPSLGIPAAPPFVVVISGPSGVGKSVICEGLLSGDPSLVRSVSATTRPPRGGEVDGVDYAFWSEERFEEGVRLGHFLEWADVHGHRYGTPRERIEELLAQKKCPLLNVDVQGGHSVKRLLPESVLVLVAPPSLPALEERLRGRAVDSEEEMQVRLANASRELAEWRHYDFVVVNDVLEDAVRDVAAVIRAERARVARLTQE
jgi:guanylate kinase